MAMVMRVGSGRGGRQVVAIVVVKGCCGVVEIDGWWGGVEVESDWGSSVVELYFTSKPGMSFLINHEFLILKFILKAITLSTNAYKNRIWLCDHVKQFIMY